MSLLDTTTPICALNVGASVPSLNAYFWVARSDFIEYLFSIIMGDVWRMQPMAVLYCTLRCTVLFVQKSATPLSNPTAVLKPAAFEKHPTPPINPAATHTEAL